MGNIKPHQRPNLNNLKPLTKEEKERKFLSKLRRGHTISDAALLAGYHPQYIWEKARKDKLFAKRMASARAKLHDVIIGNLIEHAKEDPNLGLKVMGKLDKRNWGDTKTIEHTVSDSFNDMMEVIQSRSKTLLPDEQVFSLDNDKLDTDENEDNKTVEQ